MNTLGTKFILANQFIFDPNSNTLFNKTSEESVRLGSNESRILLMFVLHPLDVIKRDELHDFVWRQQGFEVDNSSLTQAISTLRKILDDSTKSPAFVKTVPKRGYQFIATVEKTTASKSAIQAQDKEDAELLSESSNHQTSDQDTNSQPLHSESPDKQIVKEQQQEPINKLSARGTGNLSDKGTHPAKHWPKTAIISLFLAILIPILAFSSGDPKATTFHQLDIYKNVSIEVPANNPELASWLPSIELCLNRYEEMHKDQPSPARLIATGGLEDKLSLNYVFLPENQERNVTITIVADHDELSRVCR
ncbi:winged helix-turn-helix domain-containing protein [Vibrio salinus]|uniref:winged helix-turn-helix domain-containing protein n=1 Tax=Vibrio salinus TaxID=2899784 RepID=UPI001E5CA18C|nr:transcriptional regulator [Vibrio salinus]MCE0492991.1 transcriptional regulator [Vibrio salinus]